jgi:hypothetical protein
MHSLDLTVSQRLREPTPWELAQYRTARKSDRVDWTRMLDEALLFTHDDATLRAIESEARREDVTRARWFAPAPAACAAAPRTNVFRGLFQKDIGGVSGASDVWIDSSFVTAPSGKVVSFTDYIDSTHVFSQATTAKQALVPAADAALSNALSVDFPGTSTCVYYSNRPASLWANYDCFSGHEFELVAVGVPTNVSTAGFWMSSRNSADGVTLFVNGGQVAMQLRVNSGANILVNVATGGTLTAGVGCYMNATANASGYTLNNRGQTGLTGALAATPVSSTPESPLAIGARAIGESNPGYFRLRAMYAFRRKLSAAHETVKQGWIQRETGVLP